VPAIDILKSKVYRSTLSKCFGLLSQQDRRKLSIMACLQLLLSLLDLIGVALIGVVASLAINGIGSNGPSGNVGRILQFMGLSDYSFQSQTAILGAAAVLVMVTRTLLSVFLVRRTLFFLGRRGATISSDLFAKVISQSLQGIQRHSVQEYVYSVTFGVEVITLRILAQFVTLVSDGSLLIVMAIGLLFVDPVMAISSFLILAFVSFILYRMMHKRARRLGLLSSQTDIESKEKVAEAISAFREITVKNQRSFYAKEFQTSRIKIAEILAENNFMPYMSKYVIESSVVLAALFIAAAQFMLSDAVHAVSTLSVFLAAGTRIAPAVLRLQQGAIQISGGIGTANSTLLMIEELNSSKPITYDSKPFIASHDGFNPEINVFDLNLKYLGANKNALNDVSLSIPVGIIAAIVGPSGAGKTSLIDALLGVTEPSGGAIKISGLSPSDAINIWPGAIAYVPQEINIANGTIAYNVALGYQISEISESQIWSALETAQLAEFVRNLPLGLQTQVGDRGSKLSGGQRQRLGIARALLSNPKLLVLDEATSALDGKSELDVSDAINALKGMMTVVLIAHRLSTVRNADLVVYLENGDLITSGSFDEVRKNVPDFDHQAKLMGI
jgi:ABC-type multidrug transport system fused ATPase/permease subunit